MQGFRSSDSLADTGAPPQPAINPLQQTPAPLSQRSKGLLSGDADAEAADETGKYARAILRGVAISPQKLNDFARILRGLHIEDALIQCRMHPKKAAGICEKLLLSARANAVNNHKLVASKLQVDEAWVGRGRHLKRVSLHGRGRQGKKYKYRSHLTVILKEEHVPRRTKIVPMLQERKKWWNLREGRALPAQRPWSWWPQRVKGRQDPESG